MKRCLMRVLVFGGLVGNVWALSPHDLDRLEGICFSHSRDAALSCNDLGDEYRYRKDYVKARELYKRACDMDSRRGCEEFESLRRKGLGVPPPPPPAPKPEPKPTPPRR